VLWPPGSSLDSEEYVATLETQHIPLIRNQFPDGEYTLIIVRCSHHTHALCNRFPIRCADSSVCTLRTGVVPSAGQFKAPHRSRDTRLAAGKGRDTG
jgi:hypothetical protein